MTMLPSDDPYVLEPRLLRSGASTKELGPHPDHPRLFGHACNSSSPFALSLPRNSSCRQQNLLPPVHSSSTLNKGSTSHRSAHTLACQLHLSCFSIPAILSSITSTCPSLSFLRLLNLSLNCFSPTPQKNSLPYFTLIFPILSRTRPVFRLQSLTPLNVTRTCGSISSDYLNTSKTIPICRG